MSNSGVIVARLLFIISGLCIAAAGGVFLFTASSGGVLMALLIVVAPLLGLSVLLIWLGLRRLSSSSLVGESHQELTAFYSRQVKVLRDIRKAK